VLSNGAENCVKSPALLTPAIPVVIAPIHIVYIWEAEQKYQLGNVLAVSHSA